VNCAVLNYRPDIDGLRALAVVPVVLFHADVALFSGGFVGVDVFFVISGYLITAMLLQDIAAKRFSILDFYVRRARRILPALLAVVAATLLAGFFLLPPNELEQVAKAARRIAVFASNHLFWQTQNDYWQQSALANQPLLHTWSLAVEEQFYLIMPWLLLLCFKLKQRLGVLSVLSLLGAASLAMGQYWLTGQAAAAFYLLPSRAFELLVGATLAVVLQQGNRQSVFVNQWIGSIGFAFIGASIFFYHEKMPFPGVAALLPCLGAAAVIYAGAANHSDQISWVNRLLKNRGLVFVGLMSYSLYLWHWPVLVLVRSIGWYAWDMPRVSTEILIVGIFLVSWASWRWIELPFRVKKTPGIQHHDHTGTTPAIPNRRPSVVAISALGALILCWSLGAGTRQMVQHQPLPVLLAELDRETSVPPGVKCRGKDDVNTILSGASACIVGDVSLSKTPTFVLVGDSHAVMWTAALEALGHERQQSIMIMAYSSCTPLVNYVAPTRTECAPILRKTLDDVAHSSIRNVVLAGYWMDAANNIKDDKGSITPFNDWLGETVATLRAHGKSVYIVRDIPILDSDHVLREKTFQSLRNSGAVIAAASLEKHRNQQAEVDDVITRMQHAHDVIVLDPAVYICPDHMCLVAEAGKTLYQDKHHLTDAAARKFRNVFEPLFASGL